jgi:sulfide:quinone oxidoreductase
MSPRLRRRTVAVMPIDVVIAGAGPAALETALALRHHAPDHVALTLLAPDGEFVYRPLSVAEPFALGSVRRYPLGAIAADLHAAHVPGTLAAIDADAHAVHLRDGTPVRYDVLVIAVGARTTPVFPRALTFGGPDDAEVMHGLVQDVEMGYVMRLAFVVPPGTTWPLPLYELALMTAERAHGMYAHPEIDLVTPETAPLEVFGARASAAVRSMVEAARIRLHCASPATVENGSVVVLPSGERLAADRVVSLPAMAGPAIPGLPRDAGGFLPVDRLGAVRGVEDVFAAGDATDFPVKQGGLATQQADAVASAIAARAGAPVTPQPFEPVLRGMLLTEHQPRWLRDDAAAGEQSAAAGGLWWPPTKIAGRWLAPYLLGRDMDPTASPGAGLPIEVRLDRRARASGAHA